LHRDHQLRIVVNYDPGPAALAHAWASGASWEMLRNYTFLDEGDICRVLKRTHGLLLQAAALEEVEPEVRKAAAAAAALLVRFPVIEPSDDAPAVPLTDAA